MKEAADIVEFVEKTKLIRAAAAKKYGNSLESVEVHTFTDIISSKLNRAYTVLKKGAALVEDEDVLSSIVGAYNYSILAIHSIMGGKIDPIEELVIDLHLRKNHDYGDAWLDYRTLSLVDVAKAKIKRLKNFDYLYERGGENSNQLITDICSEYYDIAVYCFLISMKIS